MEIYFRFTNSFMCIKDWLDGTYYTHEKVVMIVLITIISIFIVFPHSFLKLLGYAMKF